MRFYPIKPRPSKLVLKVFGPILLLFIVFCYCNASLIYRSIIDVNLRSSYMTFIDAKFRWIEFFSAKQDSLEERKTLVVKMTPTNYVLFQKERAHKTKNYILNGVELDSVKRHNYYKAKVRLGNAHSKAKLKLFGLYPDHFGDSDGHSFRIKYKGDEGFGKKKVNVLKPFSRSYNLDYIINMIFEKSFKGLRINAEPVEVIFNKKNYGIYLIEDFFDKYLIEENLKRESVLFEIVKDKVHFNHVPKKQRQSKQLTMISDMIATKNNELFFKFIDEEKLFGFLAFTLILNDNHNALDINVHWYYNPLTNSFEPTIRETKIKPIESDINEDDFYNSLKMILGRRNPLLSNWMVSRQLVTFNKNISKALTKIERQFASVLEDSSYINFKYKLIGFNTSMVKNEKIFEANFHKLKKKKREVLQPIENKIISISNDTILHEDLYIHKNEALLIEAGTTITLANDADIIISAGKLTINGTAKHKVKFVVDENSASSIYMNTKEETKITYTSFLGLSALQKGLWKLPSSITLFETDASFLNCEFVANKKGDDMINSFACNNVIFKDCDFLNIKSDALDADFSNVRVSNCSFSKIGNDAIDGSGSTLHIQESNFEFVEDKAISAGENSRFTTKFNTVLKSELGMVCKDGSHLISKGDTLENNRIDVVLFKKKPIYASPFISLKHTVFTSNLVEEDARFTGISLPTYAKDIDKKLYGNEYGKATE